MIICFLLLTAAMVIAYQTPATGYEISIYSSTPLVVWILFFAALAGGVSIVIHQIVTFQYKTSRLWMLGLLVIILARATLLLIPYIRGYADWQGDQLTHIGFVKDIVFTGHLPSDDYYPVVHILLFAIMSITGLDITVANLSTAMISLLFVAFTYILARAIFPNKDNRIIAALIASAIMLGAQYNVYLMPNGWSILFLPLLFYLYLRSSSFILKGLFIFFLIIYPLFHPLSALIVIICIACLEVLKKVVSFAMKRRSAPASRPVLNASIAFVFIGLVSFLPWVLSFQNFKLNMHLMWQHITTGFGTDQVAVIGVSLNKLNMAGFDVVVLLLKIYGADILLILISFLGMLAIWKSIRSSGLKSEHISYLSLAVVFILTGFIYFAFLVGFPGLSALAGGRFFFYSVIFTPLLAAPALSIVLRRVTTLWSSWQKEGQRRAWITNHIKLNRLLFSGIIIAMLMLASISSVISLYPSPLIAQPNTQVTDMDLQGVEWVLQEKEGQAACAYILTPPHRLADALLGTINGSIAIGAESKAIVPDHFGYNETEILGQNSTFADSYVLIGEIDRTAYTGVWNGVGRFSDADFDRFALVDSSASRIYVDGGYSAYRISG
ncbi:MAG: hypothetical protein SA339_04010 [Methanomassiliicoccus sp.]|nr:hypothetical protein [Methanomassiliicoccus sp.]